MIKELVVQAYIFSKKAHEGQVRKFSHLPYFTHPKAVARIVEQLTKNATLTAAALLHDSVEDSTTSLNEIESLFGKNVASLVSELTNKNLGDQKKRDYLKQKLIHLSSNALIIKLADRYHNVLFLESDNHDSNEKRKFTKYYYEETRHILNELIKSRRAEGKRFTSIHKVLYNKIISILDFLKIRYNFIN